MSENKDGGMEKVKVKHELGMQIECIDCMVEKAKERISQIHNIYTASSGVSPGIDIHKFNKMRYEIRWFLKLKTVTWVQIHNAWGKALQINGIIYMSKGINK